MEEEIDLARRIIDPKREGWELLYTINKEIGVYKSTWGERRKFNKKQVEKLVMENEIKWNSYNKGIKYLNTGI